MRLQHVGTPQSSETGRWWVWTLSSIVVFGLAACRQVVVERFPPPPQPGLRTSYADVISNVAPSVVSVFTHTSLKDKSPESLTNNPALRQFFQQQNAPGSHPVPREVEGLGSGVLVSRNGYILTSDHLVEGCDQITVTMASGQELIARVVGTDPPTDVAVLKVEARNLPAARLADSNRLRVGDVVLAIGNPFGVGQTITSGIVSATERAGFGLSDYEDFIQTDASINPGNSGGALVDTHGRVVGISMAILSSGGGFEGIGLAVPVNLARSVMDQLIRRGKVVRGYFGVSLRPLSAQLASALELPAAGGALVTGLVPDSPAARAGVQDGDVIIEADGKTVENSRELRLRLGQSSPGTRLRLKVLRGGGPQDLTVTLGELPDRKPGVAVQP